MNPIKKTKNKFVVDEVEIQYLRRDLFSSLGSFKDKFIFPYGEPKHSGEYMLLLECLTEIHKRYTEYRYIVWFEDYKEMYLGEICSQAINLHDNDETYLTTFVHEIGHGFDISELKFDKDKSSKISQEYNNLMKLLMKSKVASNIKKILKSNDLSIEDRRNYEYYLNSREMFARCYTYYIKIRLDKYLKGMYKKGFVPCKYSELAYEFSSQYDICLEAVDACVVQVYWDRDEFNDIYKSMDRLIKIVNKYGMASEYKIELYDPIGAINNSSK